AGFSTGALLPPFRVPGLRVAAKTGTGEFAGEVNAQGELPTHGWFTAFAPANDPQISVTAFVDRGSGSKDAAPIAMRIIRHYFSIPEDLQATPVPAPTVKALPQPTVAPVPPAQGARPAATAPLQVREPTPVPTPQATLAPTPDPGTNRARAARTPAPGPAQPQRNSAPAQP